MFGHLHIYQPEIKNFVWMTKSIGLVVLVSGLAAIVTGTVYGETTVCHCPSITNPSDIATACPCAANAFMIRNVALLFGIATTITGIVILIRGRHSV